MLSGKKKIDKFCSNKNLFLIIPQPSCFIFLSKMSFLPRFRLPSALHEQLLVTGPSAPPLMLCLDSRMAHVGVGNTVELEPEPVDMEGGRESSRGSSLDTSDNADSPDPEMSRSKGGFNIEWANLAEFDMWRWEEERIYSIELVGSTSRTGGKLWSRRQLYVCGREASGGGDIQKETPQKGVQDRNQKIGLPLLHHHQTLSTYVNHFGTLRSGARS